MGKLKAFPNHMKLDKPQDDHTASDPKCLLCAVLAVGLVEALIIW